eukprot:11193196-Lingulodinium_polyedra.AAC.1
MEQVATGGGPVCATGATEQSGQVPPPADALTTAAAEPSGARAVLAGGRAGAQRRCRRCRAVCRAGRGRA